MYCYISGVHTIQFKVGPILYFTGRYRVFFIYPALLSERLFLHPLLDKQGDTAGCRFYCMNIKKAGDCRCELKVVCAATLHALAAPAEGKAGDGKNKF